MDQYKEVSNAALKKLGLPQNMLKPWELQKLDIKFVRQVKSPMGPMVCFQWHFRYKGKTIDIPVTTTAYLNSETREIMYYIGTP